VQKINAKNVLEYSTLPGIFPRIKSLFGSGFGQIAFLIAYILQAARLLPPNHPYLNPVNIGKFSIRQVFAQAGSHLVFDRQHIDQIVIFVALMSGFTLLVLQFVFLIVSFLFTPAHAQFAVPFVDMFDTALPDQDIAFQLMDKIFGVPGFFGSSFDMAAPLPFQEALQGLFAFYSYALLLIAVIVFLYYVFVLIAETAQSGTPFGRRFNHLWAPLRLVVALGLLVPITWGFNSAQYIVLTAAKMGSGFATNGWLIYNSSLDNALGVADNEKLFARPKVPDTWPIAKFMLLANTCREAYRRLGVADIGAYLAKPGAAPQPVVPLNGGAQIPFRDAVDYYGQRDVTIVFGRYEADDSAYGNVIPYCGSVIIYVQTSMDGSEAGSDPTLIGPWTVQEQYYAMIAFLWGDSAATIMGNAFAEVVTSWYLPEDSGTSCRVAMVDTPYSASGITCAGGVTPDFFREMRNNRQQLFEVQVLGAYDDMVAAAANIGLSPELQARGWAGAGMWYNKLAEMNGVFSAAVTYLPAVGEYPMPLKALIEEKRKKDKNIPLASFFTPHLSSGETVVLPDRNMQLVMQVLHQAFEKMGNDSLMMESETLKKQNVFIDTINYFTGLNGIYTLRENSDIHPMVGLVALGKGIVDSAIRSLFTATLFSFGSGLAGVLPDGMGAAAGFMGAASSIFSTVATLGLSIGFILYYVIPFLPFIYFYFAVGAWVKTVFEAMVGVPLWALAHLRIDGNGLPGDSAMGGYYMILEIFLRPILTVFGLIGSLIIFAALVRTLHDIFPLVTSNLAGFDNNPCDAAAGACDFSKNVTVDPTNAIVTELLQYKRSTIDEFFFTIIYTIIVYMMATASFKLIDQVPQQILRWMGAGTQVFADNMPDAAQNLKGYIGTGAFMMTSNLSQSIIQSSGRLGSGLAKALKSDKDDANLTGGIPGAPRGQGRSNNSN
jgi:conjugal transfer/type IV secretion protein DotA/TraY